MRQHLYGAIARIEAVQEYPTRSTRPRRAEIGRRILIVEDNADARQALRWALERMGHEIFEADSGQSAVEATLAEHPDIALIGIGLPEFDGYEVARRIRSAPELRGIVLFALTGYGQPEDRRKALQAGFDAHLVKPLDFDQLAFMIEPGGQTPLQSGALQTNRGECRLGIFFSSTPLSTASSPSPIANGPRLIRIPDAPERRYRSHKFVHGDARPRL